MPTFNPTAPPSALSVAIVGTLVEGSQVLVKAVYGGGIEGESTFEYEIELIQNLELIIILGGSALANPMR